MLRFLLAKECKKENKHCKFAEPRGVDYNLNTVVNEQWGKGSMLKETATALLESTFCAQPPGDTIARKGIIDSIVMGCIPIVFQPQQQAIWRAYFTLDEFASLSLM